MDLAENVTTGDATEKSNDRPSAETNPTYITSITLTPQTMESEDIGEELSPVINAGESVPSKDTDDITVETEPELPGYTKHRKRDRRSGDTGGHDDNT